MADTTEQQHLVNQGMSTTIVVMLSLLPPCTVICNYTVPWVEPLVNIRDQPSHISNTKIKIITAEKLFSALQSYPSTMTLHIVNVQQMRNGLVLQYIHRPGNTHLYYICGLTRSFTSLCNFSIVALAALSSSVSLLLISTATNSGRD